MLHHGPHPPRSREKKEIRDVSTFTAQNVRAATRSIKCERQWCHVALATAGPMLIANNIAAYPLHISNSEFPLRISNKCLMSVHTIYNHVKSKICYLCFMQHAWSCYFFFFCYGNVFASLQRLICFCNRVLIAHSAICISDFQNSKAARIVVAYRKIHCRCLGIFQSLARHSAERNLPSPTGKWITVFGLH